MEPIGSSNNIISYNISSPQSTNNTDVSQFQLTQEQVDQYWRDGYLSGIRVLSDEQCQLLLDDYQTFMVSELALD